LNKLKTYEKRKQKTKYKTQEVRYLAAEADHIDHNTENDGVDRRGFLKCMAWAGTGMLWTVSGGVLGSRILSPTSAGAAETPMGDFNFVQISDSHIGFNKPANTDVVGTLKQAIAKINALPAAPDFILHTGDLSHLSEPEEFDTLDQLLKTTKAGQIFYVPGEHDVISDGGKEYRARYGKGTKGSGWFSFDQKGVHFIGLVNVMNIAEGGLGILGEDQLAWLKDDVSGLSSSTPIVVFAHVPLVVHLSAMGLGHARRRAGTGLFETLWFCHGAQRTHSSDVQKGGRQHHLPHRHLHCFSATRARRRAQTRPDESRAGNSSHRVGHNRGELRGEQPQPCGRGRKARLKSIPGCL
jgi:hypothetical protein